MKQLLYSMKKSGFRAALFLLVLLPASFTFAQEPLQHWAALAKEKNLSESPVWLSLLHSSGGRSAISDPDFLLSRQDFSVQNELVATLRFLYDGNPAHVCRFPARYVWLKSQLDLPPLSLAPCHDLQEFVTRAPSQQMSLIFASESLAQPASMMGHSFLKLSGQQADGPEVSHAVTFFTEAEGYNLPKLFVQSTVLGKQGFFALSPFDEELDRYLKKEQRKVWSYDLKLDAPTRKLIQYHLQELKQTNLVYFFQSYNCATLLRHVLALSGKLAPSRNYWISPKDVVQDVSQAGLVDKVSVNFPSAWAVRVLSEQLSPHEREKVARHVAQENVQMLSFDPQSDHDYLRFEMSMAYANYLHTQQPENPSFTKMVKTLSNLNLYPDRQLQMATVLDPAHSPPDSQLSVSMVEKEKSRQYRISFLPASHLLIDNNCSYTQETELQLMGVSAYVDQNQRVGLDRLTLYRMQSYIPYSPLVGGLSSKFLIQWGANPYQAPDMSRGWVLSSAAGRTYQTSSGIDVFGLIGAGYANTNSGKDNLPLTAELGAIVREVANMKTVVSYERRHDVLHHDVVKDQLQIDQSKYLTRDFTVFGRWRKSLSGSIRFTEWEFGLKTLF